MANFYYKLLKLNRVINNHQIKFASVLFADLVGFRHLFLSFDPILACNLRCKMCYFSNDEWRKNNKGIFKPEDINRIAELFFKKAYQLNIGCGAEPTLYRNFIDIIKLGKKYKIPFIGFVSNGQLLTEEHIKNFISLGLNELTLSIHGIKKETFEKFMVNASYEKFKNLLLTIERLKKTANSKLPNIRINYTVNPDNLEELSDFFNEFGEFHINILQIRPIIDLGDTVYTNKDFSTHIKQYAMIINKLSSICKEKKIILMANKIDPTYNKVNYTGIMKEYVKRYISPQRVWQTDFDWRNDSYENYCKKIKWRRTLFCNIFKKIDKIVYNTPSLSYDIM